MPVVLPPLPAENEDPWYAKRSAWDAAVKAEVETGIPATYVPKSLVDAKGDLIAATANDTPARVAVGADGQVLTADAASPAGVKWAPGGGGAAPSPGGTGPTRTGFPGRVVVGRTDTAHTSNRVTAVQIIVSKPITVNMLSTDFINADGTGGKVRVALYAAPTQDSIGPFVTALGNVPMAAGQAKVSVTPVVVPAGSYWLAQHSDFEGTITAAGTRVRQFAFLSGSADAHSQGLVASGTLASGAAWPASFPSPLFESADIGGDEKSGFVSLGWTE